MQRFILHQSPPTIPRNKGIYCFVGPVGLCVEVWRKKLFGDKSKGQESRGDTGGIARLERIRTPVVSVGCPRGTVVRSGSRYKLARPLGYWTLMAKRTPAVEVREDDQRLSHDGGTEFARTNEGWAPTH